MSGTYEDHLRYSGVDEDEEVFDCEEGHVDCSTSEDGPCIARQQAEDAAEAAYEEARFQRIYWAGRP